MICEHCHKENRSIAKFCKWCGQPLVSQNLLDKLVGLDDVKKQLKTIVDTYAFLRSRKDIAQVRVSVNAIVIGETGTGKTALAEILRDYFYQNKIIEKPKLTMVDAVDYQRFVDKWDENIKKAKNGGGNTADVVGSAIVTLTGGKVNQSVYGGGKGQTTMVGGNVTVNIGTKTGESAPFTYTGTGTVDGNVYGGSAKGAVNTTPNASSVYDKTTNVNIYAGTVNGSVFGGGLGDLSSLGEDHADIAAINYGNTTVTVENTDNTKAKVLTAVYGGSNENGVLKGDAIVTITGGTVGTTANPITNAVFGGGYGVGRAHV